MKKTIAFLALTAAMAFTTVAISDTSDQQGMDEGLDYCSEVWGNDDLTQEHVDYIDANMLWADDEEFQANYVTEDEESAQARINDVDANMMWADDDEFHAVHHRN